MTVTWILNNICTNHCAYCPSIVHSGTNHHYDWEDAKKFSSILLEKFPRIKLAISGGEPTISPWFKDLVKMFSDAGHTVGVTTNGARTADYYRDVCQYLSYVVLSYHPSYDDPKFIEKALACAEKTHVTISVMMDSRYFQRSVDMYHKLLEYKVLGVESVKVASWTPGITIGGEYTESQIEIIDSLTYRKEESTIKVKNPNTGRSIFIYEDGSQKNVSAQDLINAGKTNFLGWDCDIGLESLLIHYHGEIRTGNCDSALTIGNIRAPENIDWPKNPFICPQTYCRCTSDVNVSKRKI